LFSLFPRIWNEVEKSH
jgi:hypothetical protein